MTDKPSIDQWQAAAAKEVKGKDLTWHTPEENRPSLVNGRPLYHSRTALHLVPLMYPAIFRPRPADQAGRSKFFHKETDMVKNTVSAPVFAVKYAGNL